MITPTHTLISNKLLEYYHKYSNEPSQSTEMVHITVDQERECDTAMVATTAECEKGSKRVQTQPWI